MADWKTWPVPGCQAIGSKLERGADGWVIVRPEGAASSAGLKLSPLAGAWNVVDRAELAVQVRNLGKKNVRVTLRIDDPDTLALPWRGHNSWAAGKVRGVGYQAVISPEPAPFWLTIPLGDGKTDPLADRYISMVGVPREFVRSGTVDGARLAAVTVTIADAEPDQAIAIGPIVARGVPAPLRNAPASKAFPFIDEYGQYIHREWKSKIRTDADFAARLKEEDADLAKHFRPANWDRFGGWAAGPKHEATGFFRVEKINGVWWMIDPDGRRFWSHGVVRVGTRVRVGGVYHGTPLPDREHYFRLPPKDSPLGAFYDTEPQSTHRYYLGRDNHAVYDHLEANLFRKYGANWVERYAVRSQRRLSNWGLNSIANSSDPAVYLKRGTPYTAIVYSAPMGRNEFRIEGSTGGWGKLPDPFDSGWRALMQRVLHTDLKESLNDPWCLGFFVDNELAWGDNLHVARATLASPATQPAKLAFLADLKQKYPDIDALNRAWTTRHASWEAFMASTAAPPNAADADLEVFSGQLLDAYFRGCREAIRQASPHHMYLGCRFSGINDIVLRAAARHCEIVSYNRYQHVIDTLALPAGLDRPIVIGEFNTSAQDSPTFACLVPFANQTDRARAYRTYVRSALLNPAVIGTHWFQYFDQPTSGRFDGENFNTGLLDTCDTPYYPMADACRRMGATLYDIRSGRAS